MVFVNLTVQNEIDRNNRETKCERKLDFSKKNEGNTSWKKNKLHN